MDGTVRAQEFETTPYHAVCCTHCGYDMGYDHINAAGMTKYADYVICPECFTDQDKTAANYAPDGWYETNAPERGTMAERAEGLSTETYRVTENISACRVHEFEFPADFSWDDVSHHEIDWGLQRIRIEWYDGSESCFDMSWGELEDEDTDDLSIQKYNGDLVY